jgi:hypothetical protein
MQPIKTRTYIITGIIVVLLLGGAYLFDHRFDGEISKQTAATSSFDFSTSTLVVPTSTVSTENKSKTPQKEASPNIIRLETVAIISKSDTSGWQTYTNLPYKFTLKYPADASVRKFIDGKNSEYGIGLTLNQSGAFFAEKYFEMTTEVGKTTVCDSLIDQNSSVKSASINGQSFIRREYNDGTSHVMEYVNKQGTTCYRGYLRLNNPANGQAVAANGDARSSAEMQILEDIISTFKLSK